MTPARRALLAAPLALLGASLPLRPVRAGAQIEEPLADAVRSALAASVAEAAPPKPRFDKLDDRLAYLRWLGAASERLKRRKAEHHTRVEFLEAVWYESRRAGLETSLVLGLIQVESGFRKYAISRAGARGYMQVMPFWARGPRARRPVPGPGPLQRQPRQGRISEPGLRRPPGLGPSAGLTRRARTRTQSPCHSRGAAPCRQSSASTRSTLSSTSSSMPAGFR